MPSFTTSLHYLRGVDVTVSTPSLTAVRFTTGRIEVLINNVQSGMSNCYSFICVVMHLPTYVTSVCLLHFVLNIRIANTVHLSLLASRLSCQCQVSYSIIV